MFLTGEKNMIIFGGIDGTGEWGNDDYAKSFEFSNVTQLYKGWNEGPRHYVRGPWWVGDWTRVYANEMFKFVMSKWKAGETAVFLAGYSRGGAAVIEVAKWLKAEKIPVECLILFDPVDRSRTVGNNLDWSNTPIVDTVKNVIYAKRDPATKSRESFGNCGTVLQNPGKTTKFFKTFFATHGGMGGTPWLEPEIGFINEGIPDFKTHVTRDMDVLGCVEVREWAFDVVRYVLWECKQRLSQPAVNPIQTPVTTPIPGRPARIHIVKPGDWLSKISQTYYGDINKWTIIYKANKSVIGSNPNLIMPGMQLVIP